MSNRTLDRATRLSCMAHALSKHARDLASQGKLDRAMRATALAEALHHAAGGDHIGKRLALADAKFLARAERKAKSNV